MAASQWDIGQRPMPQGNKFYDKVLMQELGEKLLKREGAIRDFYRKADVKKLLGEVNASA